MNRCPPWIALAACCGVALGLGMTPAWATNSPIELRRALDDLMTGLPGDFDNAAQQFFETESKTPEEARHLRQHRSFQRVIAPALGEHVLVSALHRGSSHVPADPAEDLVWTLQIDTDRRAVKMEPHRRAPDALGPVEAATACTLWWRRIGSQLVGESDPAQCRSGRGRLAQAWTWQWVLTPEELWISHAARDGAGRLLSASPAGSHDRFGKERDFECLFGYSPADGPPVVLNGARMRDRGDTFVWDPRTKTPRKFYYELIRGMWPSNSGRNFEDLLRIYMYEGDPAAPAEANRLLGMGWASAASDRASFGDGLYNGRCKLFDPSAPPVKNE